MCFFLFTLYFFLIITISFFVSFNTPFLDVMCTASFLCFRFFYCPFHCLRSTQKKKKTSKNTSTLSSTVSIPLSSYPLPRDCLDTYSKNALKRATVAKARSYEPIHLPDTYSLLVYLVLFHFFYYSYPLACDLYSTPNTTMLSIHCSLSTYSFV